MRMQFVLGILAGALIGGLGVFLFGLANSDPLAPPMKSPERRSASAPAAPALATPLPAAGTPDPQGESAAAAPANTTIEPGGSLAEALDRLAGELDPAQGARTIHGSVKTEDGRPIPDARVKLSADGAPKGYSWPNPRDVDLTSYVKNAALYYKWYLANYRDAVTQADGTYRCADLVGIAYDVSATAGGYELKRIPETSQHEPVTPDAEVNFVASPAITVTFDVRNADGTIPESAEIRRSIRNTGQHQNSWSLAKNTQVLPEGRYSFSAETDDARSEAEEITLTQDSPQQTVVLQLKSPGGIRGTIVLPEGDEPSSGSYYQAHVNVLPVAPGRSPSAEEVAAGISIGLKSRSEFAWKTGPGEYVIGAGREDGLIETMVRVTVTNKMEEIKLVLPEKNRATVYVVRVYGPAGELLNDVNFSPSVQSSGYSSSGGDLGAIRKKDGSYWINCAGFDKEGRPADAEDLRYELIVTSQRFGQKTIPVDRSDNRKDLECRFAEPCHLTVTIDGLAGSRVAGLVTVDVKIPEPKGNMHRGGPSYTHYGGEREDRRAQGIFQFGPLPPGDYEVKLYAASARSAGGYSYGGLEIASHPVQLTSGDMPLTLPMPELYEVIVEAPELEPGTELRLSRDDQEEMFGGQAFKVGENACIVMPALPPGDYVLRQGHRFTDPSMSFTVTGPVRMFYAATDGTPFETEEQMMVAFMGGMAKESSKLTVKRGGGSVELTIKLLDFQKRQADLGGDVRPASQ